MNCAKCGSLLPQGAQYCGVCHEPVAPAGYGAYGQPTQGYPQGYPPAGPDYQAPAQGYSAGYQPPVQGYPQQQAPGYGPGTSGPYPQSPYQQSYAQYTQHSYPQGYQQPYGGLYGTGQPQRREPGALLNALTALPRLFTEAFRDPGATLAALMERRDVFSGPIVAAIALLVTFLCAMVLTRGGVGIYFQLVEAITGNSLASDAAGLSQGIATVAGRVGPSIGGIGVLCQALCMAVSAGVLLTYLCAICKLRFSWPLASGCVAITTLPTVAASVLAMVGGMLSPLLGLVFLLLGMVCSYVLLGAILSRATGKPEAQLVLPKMACIGISLFVSLLLCYVVAGALSGGIGTLLIRQVGI